MKMDSKGLQRYIDEYGESHRGETPKYWKVGVFRWEDGSPVVKSKEYFGQEWEANGAFHDARFDGKYADAPANDAYLVGMWTVIDGDESNPVNCVELATPQNGAGYRIVQNRGDHNRDSECQERVARFLAGYMAEANRSWREVHGFAG